MAGAIFDHVFRYVFLPTLLGWGLIQLFRNGLAMLRELARPTGMDAQDLVPDERAEWSVR